MVTVLPNLDENIEATILHESLNKVLVILEHLFESEERSTQFRAGRVNELVWNRYKLGLISDDLRGGRDSRCSVRVESCFQTKGKTGDNSH